MAFEKLYYHLFDDRSPHIDRTSRLSEDDELDDITNTSSI